MMMGGDTSDRGESALCFRDESPACGLLNDEEARSLSLSSSGSVVYDG